MEFAQSVRHEIDTLHTMLTGLVNVPEASFNSRETLVLSLLPKPDLAKFKIFRDTAVQAPGTETRYDLDLAVSMGASALRGICGVVPIEAVMRTVCSSWEPATDATSFHYDYFSDDALQLSRRLVTAGLLDTPPYNKIVEPISRTLQMVTNNLSIDPDMADEMGAVFKAEAIAALAYNSKDVKTASRQSCMYENITADNAVTLTRSISADANVTIIVKLDSGGNLLTYSEDVFDPTNLKITEAIAPKLLRPDGKSRRQLLAEAQEKADGGPFSILRHFTENGGVEQPTVLDERQPDYASLQIIKAALYEIRSNPNDWIPAGPDSLR